MQSFETLEGRRLLSADPVNTPWVTGNGTLVVVGSEGDDTIEVGTWDATPEDDVQVLVNGRRTVLPTAGIKRINFSGRGGDDYLADHARWTGVLDGGAGDDVLRGGVADTLLRDGPGDDRVSDEGGGNLFETGAGSDSFVGGPGDDTFVETDDVAADAYYGQGGIDLVTYVARDDGVRLSLDGLANDGAAGEGDNLLDVEVLVGTAGDDTIHGSDADESIDGVAGADLLIGHGGNDILFGGQGTRAYGGAGNDYLEIVEPKILDGGLGDDLLYAYDYQAFSRTSFNNDGGYDLLWLLAEAGDRTYTAEQGAGLGAIEVDREAVWDFALRHGINYTG